MARAGGPGGRRRWPRPGGGVEESDGVSGGAGGCDEFESGNTVTLKRLGVTVSRSESRDVTGGYGHRARLVPETSRSGRLTRSRWQCGRPVTVPR